MLAGDRFCRTCGSLDFSIYEVVDSLGAIGWKKNEWKNSLLYLRTSLFAFWNSLLDSNSDQFDQPIQMFPAKPKAIDFSPSTGDKS